MQVRIKAIAIRNGYYTISHGKTNIMAAKSGEQRGQEIYYYQEPVSGRVAW